MYLVIDIGGTFIKHCVMTRNAEILAKDKFPTPYRFAIGLSSIEQGLYAFSDAIEEIYREYKKNYDIQGIAMSLPGQVDVEAGICYGGGALPYLDKAHLADIISKRCDGLNVALENDGKCAALSEIWQGNAKDRSSAVVLVFGTGVGGGIVIDRKILHGKGMVAGEISYLFEDINRNNIYDLVPLEATLKDVNKKDRVRLPDGAIWTMQASVSALRREVAAIKGMREDELTGEMIFKWDEEGDEAVHNVLEDWYLNIAKHCMNMHVMLAPDIILLGGGISAEPKFIEGVKKYVDILAKFSIIYDEMEIGLCKFGNDSNLIGALFNYLQKYEGER